MATSVALVGGSGRNSVMDKCAGAEMGIGLDQRAAIVGITGAFVEAHQESAAAATAIQADVFVGDVVGEAAFLRDGDRMAAEAFDEDQQRLQLVSRLKLSPRYFLKTL